MSFKSNFQIATAIRQSLKDGYSSKLLINDIWAALVVASMSLPLSIALSIVVGLPPEKGVYASIIAGFVVPLLGGSRLQVTGPTAAFVVIIAPIVTDLGMRGLIWCQIFAGIILLIMGITRLGKYINFVPYSVTTGFTAGIAVIMAAYSLDNFLGIKLDHEYNDFLDRIAAIYDNFEKVNFYSLLVGAVTFFTIVLFKKIKYVPSVLSGLIAGGVLAFFLRKYGHDVATISSSFTYVENQMIMKGISLELPKFHVPNISEGDILEIPTLSELKTLLAPSFVIAALVALEALVCATMADKVTGSKHNADAELNALGVGNILSGLVVGMPATGAFSRTTQNINSRGKTPISSALHAVFIIVFLIAFVPLINQIPMASLSALLLVTASRLSNIRPFFKMFVEAPKADTVVMVICFFLTVFVDVVTGITVGIILASFLFMKTVAEATDIQMESKNIGLLPIHKNLPDNILVYNIEGPLFFGTAQKAHSRSNLINEKITQVIINMEHVPYVDVSGLIAIKSIINSIIKENRKITLVGNDKLLSVIQKSLKLGDNAKIDSFRTFEDAIAEH